MKRWLVCVVMVGCGRTNVSDEAADAGPMMLDAGLPPGPRPLPVAVFVNAGPTASAGQCPFAGSETDLRPQSGERLVLLRTRSLDECSGAGGEWLISREARSAVSAPQDSFVGAHTCYFLPTSLRNRNFWSVARLRQSAGLFSAPVGWCILNEEGREPVTSSQTTMAIGLYETQAAAETAVQALTRP
jgi:hypothetical protein